MAGSTHGGAGPTSAGTGWSIVLGPPGTGKTSTLLGIVDEELQAGTPPGRIAYVSFTRRAAREAMDRACARFGLTPARLPWFRTLHSLCFWALGLTPHDVLERQRLREFGDWCGVPVTGRLTWDEGTTFGMEPGDRILHMENLARVRCRPLREQYDADDDDLPWVEVDRVSRALVEFKRAHHLLDYTDMLQQLVAAGDWRAGLDVVLVDEAQDLSALQWAVVDKVAAGARRVVVAGDDDQAIYGWAGAAVDQFISMSHPASVLALSHRVPVSVQEVAQHVISRISHRRPKEWLPRGEPGVVERIGGVGDADLSGSDVLILARNNYILRDQVLPVLRAAGVLYQWHGQSSVQPSTLAAIVTWEKLRRGEEVPAEDVVGAYGLMSTGRGVLRGFKGLPGMQPQQLVSMQHLREHGGLVTDAIWHDALDRIPEDERLYMVRALRGGERLQRTPRIRLSTIHGSKGGEADHVVLLRDMARRTHDEMWYHPDDESRTWYVGVTRARQRLSIAMPATARSYDV